MKCTTNPESSVATSAQLAYVFQLFLKILSTYRVFLFIFWNLGASQCGGRVIALIWLVNRFLGQGPFDSFRPIFACFTDCNSICICFINERFCWQFESAKSDLSVPAINDILDGVASTSGRDDMYGGDLRALTSLLTVAVDQSIAKLLPTVDSTTGQALAANISSVSWSVDRPRSTYVCAISRFQSLKTLSTCAAFFDFWNFVTSHLWRM